MKNQLESVMGIQYIATELLTKVNFDDITITHSASLLAPILL